MVDIFAISTGDAGQVYALLVFTDSIEWRIEIPCQEREYTLTLSPAQTSN